MKTILRFSSLLLLIAFCLLQAQVWAGDKNEPPKKPEPANDVTVNGELINADVKDKVRTQSYCKTYVYKMVKGTEYQLDMKSKDFDSFLRLENPEGVQVAFDDDSGGFPDARIIYSAPKTGDYTIICTTFGGGSTGKFNLIVKEKR
jgi:hypothetical protein